MDRDEDAVEQIRILTSVRLNPRHCPERPHPKQAAFLLTGHREVLFGGAAGGGKSSALLMAALQFADVPGYSALILRSTYASLVLPDGLVPRSKEWLAGSEAKWSESEHTWSFPNGATLTFGHLEHDKHKYRYASSAYQFIGFEELTEFARETDYRFMFSRLRRPSSGPLSEVPLRMRATTNPIGPGEPWVRRRFIASDLPPSRVYLPSTLDDNPSLDTAEYEASLDELPPTVKAKLRWGDWTTMTRGDFFPRDRWRFIEPEDLPELPWLCRYWDLAGTEPSPQDPDPDWTVGVKMGRDHKGNWYVFRPRRFRANPDQVEARVLETAREDGRYCYVRIEQEPGQSGKAQVHYYVKLLAGHDVDGIRSSGSKEVRAGGLSSQQRKGNVYIVNDGGSWISCYLDELEDFPYAEHDDQVDGSTGAFNFLVTAKPKRARRRAFGPRI